LKDADLDNYDDWAIDDDDSKTTRKTHENPYESSSKGGTYVKEMGNGI